MSGESDDFDFESQLEDVVKADECFSEGGARGRSSVKKRADRSGARSAKSMASPKRTPKKTSPAQQKDKRQQVSPKLMKCLRCPGPRYRKTRWCSLHRRSFDNMKVQAKEKDELEVFEKAMERDDSAVSMMEEWDEVNPPSKKFRKKNVLNWARFRTVYGVEKSVTTQLKRKNGEA